MPIKTKADRAAYMRRYRSGARLTEWRDTPETCSCGRVMRLRGAGQRRKECSGPNSERDAENHPCRKPTVIIWQGD